MKKVMIILAGPTISCSPEICRDQDFGSHILKFGVNIFKIIYLRAQMELKKVLEHYIDAEKQNKSIGIGLR